MNNRSNRAYKEKRRQAESTLRLLRESGAVTDDYTIEDLLDELNISESNEDRTIEAEAVILFFNLNGEGFREQTCPMCKKLFAVKYKITTHEFQNPPKIHENMKPAQKEKILEEIEDLRDDETNFNSLIGFKCSNACRALALKEIGITWSPHKRPEERWVSNMSKGELPLVVPPPAYEIMIEEHNIRAAIS